MSTLTKPRLWTTEQFEKIEGEVRYDLIEGELRPMPPQPGWEHGTVTYDLSLDLGLFVRQHDLGQCVTAETRFIIERNPDTAIAPDWAFVRKERVPEQRIEGFAPFAPDAVLEVVSPSDRRSEVAEKVRRWLDAGVLLVWVLEPNAKKLTIHRPGKEPRTLGPDDFLDGEDVLPGLRLHLKTILR